MLFSSKGTPDTNKSKTVMVIGLIIVTIPPGIEVSVLLV